MTPESLALIGTCDMSGLLRGVSLPWTELERHMGRGVAIAGGAPLLLPFEGATEPAFAAVDDLILLPDPATRAFIPSGGAPDLVVLLGDLLERDGAPWECCPRYFLRRGLAALHAEFGLTLQAGFSQGLHYAPGGPAAAARTAAALREQGVFGGTLLAAMRANGIAPDGFEAVAQRQFTVTAAPTTGVGAADAAVIVRELARAVAAGLGQRAVLAPLSGAAGSTTRIGLCLLDEFGRSAMNDAEGEHGLSFEAEHVVAGVLFHLPAIAAVLTPSVISYDRLSAGPAGPKHADLSVGGRGGAVRLFTSDPADDEGGPQLQLELQVADAAASPYLALGVLVWAGLDGLRRQRRLADLQRTALPGTLARALEQFEESVPVAEWFGPVLREAYLRFKRAEIEALTGLDAAAVRARYGEVY